MARLTYEEELTLAKRILIGHGAAAELAHLQAIWLAEGDARGHPSHGIQRLPLIVTRMRAGLTNGTATPRLTWSGSSLAHADGNRCFGPVAGVRTLEALLERAATTGVAIGLIRNANHLGMLAPYVERAADRGSICLALTTTEALVHPWGGIAPLVGTNPVAVGVPAAPAPFVLDMSTAAVSMGRILHHRHTGTPLEPGWAIDADGKPTLDPERAAAISPFGGAKGYGLALAFELLTAALTGSALGTAVAGTLDAQSVCNKGDVIACFASPLADEMLEGISAYLNELRSTSPQPGTHGVSIPGDRARARRDEHLRRGVHIPAAVWSELQALAEVA
jgi:L-2-hydroxycarboxylate dehydrogenase (NAD+)